MILITGATGFLGTELIKHLDTSNVRVLSRNEGTLVSLKQQYPDIEIMTGDVADEFMCQRALQGVEKVYHLAAFKHVGQAETQPYQCTNSNVVGTMHLLKYFKGKDFIAISTDKAAKVAGIYGASKLLMEGIMQEYETLNPDINYRVIRYGNVLYSTGSVLVKWKKIFQEGGEIVVTDPNATRFFWSVGQAIDLIFECEAKATNCQPYCPEMKAMRVGDLLNAMAHKYSNGEYKIRTIGLQKGENMHESLSEEHPTSEHAEKFTVDEILELI